MKPQRQTRRAKQQSTVDTVSLTATLPSVMMFAMTAETPWAAEVNTIQIGLEEAVIYNCGPDDLLDPDEPIRDVVQLPYHGGWSSSSPTAVCM